ncbi:hypothetical protein A0J61_11018, partial [Choanephora cucurbitarum]
MANYSFEIVMDEHCFAAEYQDMYVEQTLARELRDNFVKIVDMDGTSASDNIPHNEVQQLVTLSEYKPSVFSVSAPKQKKIVNAEKAPTAAQVTKRQYRKYTEQQIEELFCLVFEEGKTAAEAARATGIVVRTGQDYVQKARLFLEEERIAEEEEVDSDEEVVPPVPSVLKDRKHGSQKLFQAYSLFFL